MQEKPPHFDLKKHNNKYKRIYVCRPSRFGHIHIHQNHNNINLIIIIIKTVKLINIHFIRTKTKKD